MESNSSDRKSVPNRFAERRRNLPGWCAIGGLAFLPAAALAQEHGELSAIGTVLVAGDRAASSASTGDDHGNTSATATLLPVGATLPGRIDGSTDVDVFRLDLPGRAEIEVRTVGSTDTAGELLDSTGARLMSDDDGGPGDNFAMTAELDPGVYYAEVRGAEGDYAVNARLGGARDHGDTTESSTLLKLHTQEELAAVRPQVLLATSGRIYPTTDDADVFRIDVAADATAVDLRTSGSVDTYASLVDSSEDELVFADGDRNFRIDRTLDAGIYYVKVRGHGVGAYRILGSMAPTTSTPEGPSPEEPPDEADAITGEISECSARLVDSDVNATIRGTVTANRSVTDLELTGYANDHLIGTEYIGSLAAGSSSSFDIRGTYPFDGTTTLACRIAAMWNENSQGGGGGGTKAPDLVVAVAVDDDTPDVDQTFEVSATVRNRGEASSETTTVRYYRSTDPTITRSDLETATDSVEALPPSGRATEVSLYRYSRPGTYYFGACVDSVADESDTENNCSAGVKVEVVSGGGGGADSYCRVGDTVAPGERCDIYDWPNRYFEVSSSGRGCLQLAFFRLCGGNSVSYRSGDLTLVAERDSDDSWTIDDVEPEPAD